MCLDCRKRGWSGPFCLKDADSASLNVPGPPPKEKPKERIHECPDCKCRKTPTSKP